MKRSDSGHPAGGLGAGPWRIALFDLDGVLLRSGGYHTSLQHVVRIVGRSLGFSRVELSPDAIAMFEAAGATAEWDSSAICAALLLRRAWEVDPHRVWPSAPPLPSYPSHNLAAPDFFDFAKEMLARGEDTPPLLRAEAALTEAAERDPPHQAGALAGLLRAARSVSKSLTHRLIQELNLGSARFAALYALPPCLDTRGLLEAEDRPALSHESLRRLHTWRERPRHRAAVFTNRPSLPPDGSFGVPEGELGIEVAGLSELPLVGMGPLEWLSGLRGEDLQAHLKPSPVHALAALRCAVGDPVDRAVKAAAELALDGVSNGWDHFDGVEWVAYEDTAPGMRSVLSAASCLRRLGLRVRLRPVGVTDSLEKARALSAVGAETVSNLEDGLKRLPGWE